MHDSIPCTQQPWTCTIHQPFSLDMENTSPLHFQTGSVLGSTPCSIPPRFFSWPPCAAVLGSTPCSIPPRFFSWPPCAAVLGSTPCSIPPTFFTWPPCGAVLGSTPCSILPSFSPDHHVVLCWDLHPAPFFLVFRLTTMWCYTGWRSAQWFESHSAFRWQ